MRLFLTAISTLLLAGCLHVGKSALTPIEGRLDTLRGVERLAIYTDDEDLEIIRTELLKVHPELQFTTAENAQILIDFQFMGAPACIDCGPGFGEGPFQPVMAVGTVQRMDDRDHCLPKLLRAEWQSEAYRRATLARSFAQLIANSL